MKLSGNKSQFSTRDVLAHYLSFSFKQPPRPTKTCSLIIKGQPAATAIYPQVCGWSTGQVIRWSSLLVNMSNAAVSEPEIIYSAEQNPTLPVQLSHFKWEVEAAVPERAPERGIGIPCWKFAERRELTAPHWAKRMGAGENDLWEERSGWGGWVVVMVARARCPLGEAQGGGSKPGHLLKREQLWTLGPGEEGHCREFGILYKPKPSFSRAAFTLHRSAITKPIKKPRRGANAVSQSPLFDLATRITAQENTSQHRKKENTGNYQTIATFLFSPIHQALCGDS